MLRKKRCDAEAVAHGGLPLHGCDTEAVAHGGLPLHCAGSPGMGLASWQMETAASLESLQCLSIA